MIQYKGELERVLYLAFDSTFKISLEGALKNAQKFEEKDAFHTAVDGPLGSALERCT